MPFGGGRILSAQERCFSARQRTFAKRPRKQPSRSRIPSRRRRETREQSRWLLHNTGCFVHNTVSLPFKSGCPVHAIRWPGHTPGSSRQHSESRVRAGDARLHSVECNVNTPSAALRPSECLLQAFESDLRASRSTRCISGCLRTIAHLRFGDQTPGPAGGERHEQHRRLQASPTCRPLSASRFDTTPRTAFAMASTL